MRREKVLWFGSRGRRTASLHYEQRELTLEVLATDALTDADLRPARGIVYWFGENEVSRTGAFAEATIHKVLDHGLAVMVLAAETGIVEHVRREMDRLGVPDLLTYRVEEQGEVPDHEIAQRMLRAEPKMAWSGELVIDAGGAPLGAGDELLLRRAFSDCRIIRLSPLSGGRTAEAFMVQASLSGSRVGPKPLPFFAKLGDRRKIACEEDRYRDYAANFIPFHLRPNLDPDRCLLGARRGVLVGNFVADAKSLWDVLQNGNGDGPIRNLFGQTLDGWREQGRTEDLRLKRGSLANALRGEFDYTKVSADRVKLAGSLGLDRTLKELWATLLGRQSQAYRIAPMHGDPHPDNVFVRQADAILIDMASVRQGPMSSDSACLETALLFERRPGDDIPFDVWRGLTVGVGHSSGLGVEPAEALPLFWKNRLAAAHQVRAIGVADQNCPDEYATAVAIYLLRRGMYPAVDQVDEERRAQALVTAQRIIVGTAHVGRASGALL